MSTARGREHDRMGRLDALTTVLGGVLFAAVWLFSAVDREALAVTPEPGERAELVFTNGGRILSVNFDGSERKVLTRKRAWVGQPWGVSDVAPQVSPDGETILFNRYYDGFNDGVTTGPMVIGRDGKGLRQLIEPSDGHDRFAGAWSASGERIYLLDHASEFDGGVEKSTTTLFTVKADGTDPETILTSSFEYREDEGKVTGRRWVPIGVRPSPDGQRLLIESFNPFADRPERLEWVNPESGARSIFETEAGSAAWSPDGSRVAFTSDRDRINVTCYEGRCSGNPQIFIKEVESGAVRRLLPGRPVASAWGPSWSPDGKRIAFTSDRRPGGSNVGAEIWTVNPDGGCLNRLTNGAPDSSEAQWVPGGSTGSCVEVVPEPLGEVTVGTWALRQKPRPLWVGPSYKGWLMANSFLDGQDLGTTYDDCGRVDGNCPAPIAVSSGPVCLMNLSADLMVGQYLGVERRRGGLLVHNVRRAGITLSHFYSGGMETRIASPGRYRKRKVGFDYHGQVVRALRPVNRNQSVSGSLGDPVLPWKTVRKGRAMAVAYGKVRNLKIAAERAGIFREKSFVGIRYSKSGARAWLRFGRDLKRLGKIRSVKCRRWQNDPDSIQLRSSFRDFLE